jgi:DNA-binding beta-propeller fold protein YncE
MIAKKFLLCIALATPLALPAQKYAVTGSIPLGGSGAWDYVTADTAARRLYVSHSAEVNVIDLDTRKVVGTMTGFGFVHGVLIVRPDLGVLSDGGKAEVVVFNPKTLEIKQKIKTDANPNSLAYDAATGRLFIGHKPTKSMTVLNVATMKIEGSVPVGGLPEFPIADGKGTIFLNIDDKSEIVKIDAKTMQIVAHWPLAPCESPSGLAYSAATHRLFAACDNKLLAVVDSATGKVVATPAIGGSPDAAVYDQARKLILTSNDDGTLTVIADRGGDKFEVLQNLATEKGARTMALDAKTHAAYISAAKLGPPPVATPDNPNPTHHATSVPGTFHVIVVTSAGN